MICAIKPKARSKPSSLASSISISMMPVVICEEKNALHGSAPFCYRQKYYMRCRIKMQCKSNLKDHLPWHRVRGGSNLIGRERATAEGSLVQSKCIIRFTCHKSSNHSPGIGSVEIQMSRSALSQIFLHVSVIFLQSHTYVNAFPSLEYVTAPVCSNASL